MRILLVEDEDELAAWLARALAQSGFVIERAADGVIAEAFLGSGEFDAVVLDLRLPRKDGFAVLADMRARDDRTPVLILTAQGALDERVRGLNAGADDFLTKPFALSELEARLMALIRRSPRLRCGPLEFDTGRKAFLLSGEPLSLTPREHAALSALLHKTGQPIAKVHLFDKVFNLDSDSSPDAVEVVVHRLRKKLAGTGVQIVTVRGLGYMLEAGASDASTVGDNTAS
jgi:two-component system response regulator TctD